MTTIISLPHDRLDRHPNNMRVSYSDADIQAMAVSQSDRADRGLEPCLQPLIVTPAPAAPGEPRYIIVAGHLRHAGNVALGPDAPLLNCMVRHYVAEEDMLSDMRTENGARVEISPLGWARNIKLSLDHGVSMRELVRQSGKEVSTLRRYLSLLELCPQAQQCIESDLLPIGAVEHLLKISNQADQARLAKSLAKRNANLETIRRAVEQELTTSANTSPRRRQRQPKPANDKNTFHPAGLPPDVHLTFAGLRAVAKYQCVNCTIGATLSNAEPAWHLALSAAGDTCDCCDLRHIKNACAGCPLAEMLTRLARPVYHPQPA